MKPGIDPKVDYAFKKVFGSESNVDLLRDLLEAVLGFPISAVEIINPFNDKATSDDKLSVLDIKAKDASGRRFDVEMQMVSHVAVLPRMLYYWGKLYTGQLAQGEGFGELRPAYTVCFIEARLFHRRPDVYLNHFEAFDRRTGEVLSDHFNLYIVELPKFTRGVDEVGTTLESWCYYFEHGASLDLEHLPATLDRPPMRKAMEVLMRMSQDAQERDRYESRLKYRRDMQQFERDREASQASLAAALESLAAIETNFAATQTNLAASQTNLAATQERLAATQASETATQAKATDGLVGQIHFCQQLLSQPPTPKEELSLKTLDELQHLADKLQRRVLSGK